MVRIVITIVRRGTWGCRTPQSPNPVKTPVDTLFVHHSVTKTTAVPAADMRVVDDIGAERFGRFSYSYAIHPSGTVLEGAGDRVGAHTANRNSTSYGIVFLGNYEVDPLRGAAIVAFRELRRWLVDTGRVRPGHVVTPHRAVKATACPGAHVMDNWEYLLRTTAVAPPPPQPEPEEEEAMPVIVKLDTDPAYWLWDGYRRKHVRSQAEANLLVWMKIARPGPGGGGDPHVFTGTQATIVRSAPEV